jgi:hypothetical protein
VTVGRRAQVRIRNFYGKTAQPVEPFQEGEETMFCKRLKATMKISTCHKRQEKAQSDLGYGICRDCPQMVKVNAGKESDRDINRIIKELSQSPPPPAYYHWASEKAGRPKPNNYFKKKRQPGEQRAD